MLSVRLTSSSLRAFPNRRDSSPLRRMSFSGRAFQEDENKIHTSSDINSSSQEKLIALFKHIETSISQGDQSRSWQNYKTAQPSTHDDDDDDDDESSVKATSVLEFLQGSSSMETEVKSSKEKHNEGSVRRRRTAKKEKPKTVSQASSEYKVTRLPSKFVKRSLIPSPTPLRSDDQEVTNREVSSSEPNEESSRVEEMKLGDLKKLAKERGIRGYSKLKKSELVELLRSQLNV